LKDLNTKIGTTVNGEQIRNTTHVLGQDENLIELGHYEHPFRYESPPIPTIAILTHSHRITWVPLNFTFTFTAKEEKSNSYQKLYEVLGPLDIKVLAGYDSTFTTHLLTKKRNTARGLQALISGKFIVDQEPWIKAFVVATSPDANGLIPLKEDFEGNFPNANKYLPPKGKEPTDKDASAYSPDVHRRDMFGGYTFIFYEEKQFNSLLAPITEGRGKALLRQVIPEETTVEDFVRYVKSVAGEKGLGEFEDGSEGKGVVVVGFHPESGHGHEWYASFSRDVALRLDQRLILQNEFLEVILDHDASRLRKPLEIEPSGIVASAATNGTPPLKRVRFIAN